MYKKDVTNYVEKITGKKWKEHMVVEIKKQGKRKHTRHSTRTGLKTTLQNARPQKYNKMMVIKTVKEEVEKEMEKLGR